MHLMMCICQYLFSIKYAHDNIMEYYWVNCAWPLNPFFPMTTGKIKNKNKGELEISTTGTNST